MGSLGLLGILALWGVFGLLPAWLALIPTRGRTLVAMPLAFAAGIGGGALVALLGTDGFVAFGMSLFVAVVGGAAATFLSMKMQPQLDEDGRRLSDG